MKLQATKKIEVFIDKKSYSSNIEQTQVGKIPTEKRDRVSWKGCYYTIEPNEIFYFDRSNNWDLSYFTLENGAEFIIESGNYKGYIERNEVNIL